MENRLDVIARLIETNEASKTTMLYRLILEELRMLRGYAEFSDRLTRAVRNELQK